VTHPKYLDTLDLWEATAGLPEQILTALDEATRALNDTRLPDPGTLRSVAVLGTGAGGQAGEAVAALGGAHATVPLWVSRGYDVPAFIGPHTLAFAVSGSGDTEETREAAARALERGAHLVVVCGGGSLAEMAGTAGLPFLPVPDGSPTSRAALGAMMVPLLMTLSKLGLVPEAGAPLTAAANGLRRRRDVLLGPGSPADAVAGRIGRTIPLIYGSSGMCAVAARRWKSQVNENAKTPAFFATQPDLSHNEVAGWGQHGDVTRQILSLVLLRHGAEHPGVARRFDLVARATDEVMADVIPVWAEGEDDYGRFFDLALFGDFVSLYLAGREGIDPGPVPAVADVEAGVQMSSD